jgi:nicotinate-nucleotide adenylyltransferase
MQRRTRGLFGGTFDPPHAGHVAAVRAALDDLGLDELVVTVAADPWLKGAPPSAPGWARLEMAEAAFSSIDRVLVSDLELRRGGPTYTIDTVEALLAESPGDRLVVVVGADAAASLGAWHRSGDLAALVEIAVVPRSGAVVRVPEEFYVRTVRMVPVDLSSTSVRAALERGEDPKGLLPEAVVRSVLAHRLYSP